MTATAVAIQSRACVKKNVQDEDSRIYLFFNKGKSRLRIVCSWYNTCRPPREKDNLKTKPRERRRKKSPETRNNTKIGRKKESRKKTNGIRSGIIESSSLDLYNIM